MIELSEKSDNFNVWPAFADIILLLFVMIVLTGSLLVISAEKEAWRYKQIRQKMEDFRNRFEKQFPPDKFKDKIRLDDSLTRPNEQLIVFGGDLLFGQLDHLLSQNGQRTLNKLVSGSIEEMKSCFSEIQVLGHTDDTPIHDWPDSYKKRASSFFYKDRIKVKEKDFQSWKILQSMQFQTNWELSAARAVSVVRYITEFLKIDPNLDSGIRLTATGCSEYQPRHEREKAWNRRIEIRLIYGISKKTR